MVRVHKRPPRRGLETSEAVGLHSGPYLRKDLRLQGPYRYAHGPVVARTREQARVAGLLGAVAQLVERLLCKEEVRSSSLLGSTAAADVAQCGRLAV